MIVININAEGRARVVTPSPIFQGSNQSAVTVLAPVPTTTAMSIAFKLPDGTSTPYYPMTWIQTDNGLSQYEFTLNAPLTQKAGHAAIALMALYTDGRQTSQLVDFEIEKSIVPEVPPDIDEGAYEIIMKQLREDRTDITALQGQMNDIQETAEKAEAAANNAVETANEAKSTADGLADSIAQANTTAENAVNIANGAVATANEAKATADGLAESIAQANAKADTAISTANEANTTAEEAKEIAQEALDQSKVVGTQVSVGGEFQKELSFSSDPQTQLDNMWKFKDSTPIPANADLNDYKTAGNYAVQNADNMPSIQNKPSGLNSVFLMKVYSVIGLNNAYPVQEIISFDNQRYLRRYNSDGGGSWNDWTELADKNKVVAARGLVQDFDFNAVPTTTIMEQRYTTANANANAPTSSGLWLLTAGSSENYGTQIASSDNGYVYYRAKVNEWKSWETFFKLDPKALEPSTANGWTIGGTNLVIPASGVYLMSVYTVNNFSHAEIVAVSSDGSGNYSLEFLTNNTGGDSFVKVTGFRINSVVTWNAEKVSDQSPLTINQIAYKRIA